MAKDQAFKEYVVGEVLRSIPGITARAMFGGWGIYQDSMIFGLIAEGTLYFKVDDTNRPDYESAGSGPFTYHAPNGKTMQMGYYQVPEDVMEHPEDIPHWVAKAIVVSRNAMQCKAKEKK